MQFKDQGFQLTPKEHANIMASLKTTKVTIISCFMHNPTLFTFFTLITQIFIMSAFEEILQITMTKYEYNDISTVVMKRIFKYQIRNN